MHKQEAAALFALLGDPIKVKTIKMLYHNESLSLLALANANAVTSEEEERALAPLIEAGFVTTKEEEYRCNRELVDELMGFIARPCGCVKK